MIDSSSFNPNFLPVYLKFLHSIEQHLQNFTYGKGQKTFKVMLHLQEVMGLTMKRASECFKYLNLKQLAYIARHATLFKASYKPLTPFRLYHNERQAFLKELEEYVMQNSQDLQSVEK